MITCNLGKTHSPRYPKNIFPEVFRIRLSFLHLYQIDYMKLSTRSDRLWLFYKVLWITQWRHTTIKIKYISQIN